MVVFGTILAAEQKKIQGKSAYLYQLGELTVLANLAREMDKSKVREWTIVVGSDYDFHRRTVESVYVRVVIEQEWQKGFATQALRGLHEMPPQATGFIILPGNLPFFTRHIMNNMVQSLKDEKGFIIQIRSKDKIFPYPLFHRKFLGEVKQRLSDGKFFEMVAENESETYEIELDSPMPFLLIEDEESSKLATAHYFEITAGDKQSNPQSEIPQ